MLILLHFHIEMTLERYFNTYKGRRCTKNNLFNEIAVLNAQSRISVSSVEKGPFLTSQVLPPKAIINACQLK